MAAPCSRGIAHARRARAGPGGSEETHALEEPAIGGEVGELLGDVREVRDAVEGLHVAAHVAVEEPCFLACAPELSETPAQGRQEAETHQRVSSGPLTGRLTDSLPDHPVEDTVAAPEVLHDGRLERPGERCLPRGHLRGNGETANNEERRSAHSGIVASFEHFARVTLCHRLAHGRSPTWSAPGLMA